MSQLQLDTVQLNNKKQSKLEIWILRKIFTVIAFYFLL